MIQSLFAFIRPHIENNKIKDLKQLLKDCGAWNSFEDLYVEFGDKKADSVATFIIFFFCIDSSFFIATDNYDDSKYGVAELCGLSAEHDLDIIKLKSAGVIKAVDFVASEPKSWQWRKMIRYREAAITLGELSTKTPNPKEKNTAKNIRDSAVFEQELNEKADNLQNLIFQQSKSKERFKESLSISLDSLSMERLLKEITK